VAPRYPRPPPAQPLRGRLGEVHRPASCARGACPADAIYVERRRQTTDEQRFPQPGRNAMAGSTRSTICAASDAGCASKPARTRALTMTKPLRDGRTTIAPDLIYEKGPAYLGSVAGGHEPQHRTQRGRRGHRRADYYYLGKYHPQRACADKKNSGRSPSDHFR